VNPARAPRRSLSIVALACALAEPRLDAAPVLTLTKSTNSGGVISAGDTAVFVLTLQNVGDAFATGVVITDTLPAGLAWSTGTAGCSIDSMTRLLTCNAGSVPGPGAFVAVVTAPTDVTKCASYDNVAGATSSNANSPTSNQVTLTVGCPAFRLVQLPDAPRVKPGDPVGFRISVVNFGGGTARGAALTDLLPSGISWSLAPSVSGCGIDGGNQLACTFGDLLPGAGVALHVVAPTNAQTCGTLASTPQATGTNGPIGSITDSGPVKVLPAGDANADCTVSVQDVFALINFLFAGGAVPL